jgi:hypothetical protein
MSDHWYTPLGEPAYGTGLREARKLGLYPSITTIDKIIANPGLENWKQRQVLECSLTLTRGAEESDKDFISRILSDSKEQGRKAAKLGTVVHHMAERYLKGKSLFFIGWRPDVWEIFKPLRIWIDENLLSPESTISREEGAEVILVNETMGYAGKADFVGKDKIKRRINLDFKTTTIKPTDIKKDGTLKKAKLYPSWARQLAALDQCQYSEVRMSVVISTNKDFPGVWVHEWSPEDIEKGWIEFASALQIFKSVKNLD